MAAYSASKRREHREEGKKGDFLPLPLLVPLLRLWECLQRSCHPVRKSHFSLSDGACSQERKLCNNTLSWAQHRWRAHHQIAGNYHIHGQRNYMHVLIQIQAFRRKPKKLKFL